MDKLKELARLIRQRNEIAREIGALIGRPALVGHIGEWIAQEVFSMRLEDSAVQKGFDGRFCAGPLVGKTVNVKWYGKREGLLDVNPDGVPDLYLVMTDRLDLDYGRRCSLVGAAKCHRQQTRQSHT